MSMGSKVPARGFFAAALKAACGGIGDPEGGGESREPDRERPGTAWASADLEAGGRDKGTALPLERLREPVPSHFDGIALSPPWPVGIHAQNRSW